MSGLQRIKRFIAELKRRRVFRAAGAYLVVGWAAIEVAETVAPLLELPMVVPRAVLFLVVLGFPVFVALAWAVDLTPEGLERTGEGGRADLAADGRDPAVAADGPPDGSIPSPPRRGLQLAVIVLVTGAALVAGTLYLTRTGPYAEEIDRSIAVLPFETLGTAERSAFTEGVHAGVLTRLSGVAELDVISRTSVLRYGAADRTLPEIAEELGVAWVVRGEVQEAGDEVLVSVRLADARRDRQVWGKEYRRRLTAQNVFGIQSEIVRTIIDEVRGHLTAGEEARLGRTPTESLQAYRLYVQGRRILDRRDEGMEEALDYFRGAIAEDSTYALAWASLADGLLLLVSYGYRDVTDALPEAERALTRALELDPDLAEAHATRGMLHETRRQGLRAVAELERAIELRPSYGEAHSWRSWVQLLLGDGDEALVSARRTLEVDPLHREGMGNLIQALIGVGRAEEAAAEAERIRAVYPDDLEDFGLLGLALYHAGRADEATALLRGQTVPWMGEGPRITLGLAELATGDTAAAVDVLGRLEADSAWFGVGVLRAAMDDPDAAFAAFDRVPDWSRYWPTLAVHHFYPAVWDRLDEDPRYAEIVRRVRDGWRSG